MFFSRQLMFALLLSTFYCFDADRALARASDSNICSQSYHSCNGKNWERRTADRAACKSLSTAASSAQCLAALSSQWEERENICRAQKASCLQRAETSLPISPASPQTTTVEPYTSDWHPASVECSDEGNLQIMRQLYKGKALRMRKVDSSVPEGGAGDVIFTMGLPATDEEIADFICGTTSAPDPGLFEDFYGWLKTQIEQEIDDLRRRCDAGEKLAECADLNAYRKQRLIAVGIRG